MKKVLSILLAAAMLITAFVVVAVPVSAAKGQWSIYADRAQELVDSDIMRDIPGYQYTDEGLTTVLAENMWKDSTPYVTFQTTETIDISAGVYLQV